MSPIDRSHQKPSPREGSPERRAIDAGYVCVRCGRALGLTFEVDAGAGLVCSPECPGDR